MFSAKTSLQRCAENKPDEQILTPTVFHNFCKKNIVNTEFVYATNKNYEGEAWRGIHNSQNLEVSSFPAHGHFNPQG